ncbi:MAG: YXWGXW repeat-containing protein [Acidobacteria bacterium]|nr:YXWGXW repeat-containing protein [Acidobacteriota bacterium]MBV9478906.1 YXWGXW repeat-containing protein [Acidobacteriota bacterium]
MRKTFATLAVTCALALSGCATTVAVRPPRAELVLVEGRWVRPPRAGAVWISGHYERRAFARRVWVPGHWRY